MNSGLNKQAEFSPKGLTNGFIQSIVKIGNSVLPLLSEKKEDRSKQVSMLNYLLSDTRKKLVSKEGEKTVNHADIWNWSDSKK